MNAPVSAPGMNKKWVERRAKAVSRGIGMGAPVIAARAENSEIWDVEGNRYIDFGGGIAVVNTGHRHPLVMKRVYEQLEPQLKERVEDVLLNRRADSTERPSTRIVSRAGSARSPS